VTYTRCIDIIVSPEDEHEVVRNMYRTEINHSQHNQASSHEVLTSLVLVLLMMGIMMHETC
jgi:hypothetical protein